ncbi:YmfQ family protein [Clostridium weizhouense]|uniref:YmfQ family protein n=1 Tax=Clostridium weizhouense TaxID=2859781 RepID=A0ABS7AIH0_9CLOT|nr:YmfQ family protein [Clostridium weizhouense]MBW6408474.1 YmfQ family protein [Clostridium weizhouense]
MYGLNNYGLIKYSEKDSNEEEIKKYFIDLNKYVPSFISDIKEMQTIYSVQGTELGSLLYSINDLFNQIFIETATWGLTYWEEQYAIETNLNSSYEERREIIKAKKIGRGTTTKDMIKNVAEIFSGGEVNITEDNKNYSFIVQFIGVKGIPKNMQAFKNMLEDIKPAHLSYSFKYTFTIWDFIKEKNLDWNSAKNKLWNELKVYE